MNRRLDHEKLEVYRASLTFITWLESILQGVPKSLAVADQLDRASTSIPLNIAEGNGKFTGADRCRYLAMPVVQPSNVRLPWMFWSLKDDLQAKRLCLEKTSCGGLFRCWWR